MIGGIAGYISCPVIGPEDIRKMAESLGNSEVSRLCYTPDAHTSLAKIILFGQSHHSILTKVYSEGQWTITSDSIIYNRKELCAQLDIHQTQEAYDVEDMILLKAYIKWGKSLYQYVSGHYAFAIYNAEQQTCVLCNKGRSLFYTVQDNSLYFGTEIKAILQASTTTKELDRHTLSRIITISDIPDGRTAYHHVKALASYQWLDFNQGKYHITTIQDHITRYNLYTDKSISLESQILHIVEHNLRQVVQDQEIDKIGCFASDRPSTLLSIALLRKVLPDMTIYGSSYILPQGRNPRSDDMHQRLQEFQSLFPFQLLHGYNDPLPTEMDDSVDYKMWVNDTPTVNPIGTDHEVIYGALRKVGCRYIAGNITDNQIEPQAYSRIYGEQMRFFFRNFFYLKNKSATLKQLIKSKLPDTLIHTKRKILSHNYNPHRSSLCRQELIHKYKIDLSKISSRKKNIPKGIIKPHSSIERRYNILRIALINHPRLQVLLDSIDAKEYLGYGDTPPLVHRLYRSLGIPDKFWQARPMSWPIDWPQRYFSIMPAMYSEYDKIKDDDPIWDIVDRKKSDDLIQKMKADKTNKIYRKNYLRFNYLLLVQRFISNNKKMNKSV